MAKTIAAGFRIVHYGVVSAGRFVGSTTTAPTAGSQNGSGMTRLDGARTLPISIAEPDTVVVSGDDEPLVTFEFDAEQLPSGIFEMAVRNTAFDALVQGTVVQTIGDVTVSMINPRDRAQQTMCLLLQRRARKWEPGLLGVARWEILFIPRCTIKPLFADVEQRTFNPYRYSINTDMSDRLGWGATLTTAVNGTEAVALAPLDSDNPLALHRFTGDNSETVFNLSYTPVSGAKSYVFVNDVLQTVTTNYTVSGKAITFVAAPPSAATIEVLYEVAEANLS